MRILITGSRNLTDHTLVERVLAHYTNGIPAHTVTVVSGGCPSGADRFAEQYARQHGFRVEVHPADWNAHGRAAGPKRNQQMVDLGADVVLAFPLPGSRGTAHCMAAARRAGLTVINVTGFCR